MGIPSLWGHFKVQEYGDRVPLKKFVTDFYRTHGRAPSFAIDAYNWLFECGFITSEEDQTNDEKYYKTIALAIISLLKRIRVLISMDVTFMLVFDGPMKPSFKNKFKNKKQLYDDIEETKDHGSEFEAHLKLHRVKGTCSFPEIHSELEQNKQHNGLFVVKELLKTMNISFIDACSEGESECARLEQEGLADYVVTNDSDAFVFGATKVLKNMSKYWEDLPATYNGSSKRRESREYLVTIVDIDNAKGWDRCSILLYCVLLGADYSQGVRGLGSKKAIILAQNTEPNFSQKFYNIFHNQDQGMEERRINYASFQDEIYEFCKLHSRTLFGRNYFKSSERSAFQGWPSEYAVMHYIRPMLNPLLDTNVFRKEFNNISGSYRIGEDNFRSLENLLRTHQFRRITDLPKWFHELTHGTFLLKDILYGQKDRENISKNMKIIAEWEASICDHKYLVPSWKVRYNTFLPGISESCEDSLSGSHYQISTEKDISKGANFDQKQLNKSAFKYMLSIPKILIPNSNLLVVEYLAEHNKASNSSPKKKTLRKKGYSQKNNLDDFIRVHTSPKKSPSDRSKTGKCLMGESAKRTLFVDDEDSDYVDEDSSLMILSERTFPQQSNEFTPKRMLELSPTSEDSLSVSSTDESPLKKQKQLEEDIMLGKVRRQLEFDNVVDLTIENDSEKYKHTNR